MGLGPGIAFTHKDHLATDFGEVVSSSFAPAMCAGSAFSPALVKVPGQLLLLAVLFLSHPNQGLGYALIRHQSQ